MNALQCPHRNERLVSSSAGGSWDKHLSGLGVIAWGLSIALLEALHLFTGTGILRTRRLLPLALLGTLLVKLEEASGWPLCERSWWELSSLYLVQSYPHLSKTPVRAAHRTGHADISCLQLSCIFFSLPEDLVKSQSYAKAWALDTA